MGEVPEEGTPWRPDIIPISCKMFSSSGGNTGICKTQ